MSKSFSFIIGIVTGIYISQTYKIPNVSLLVKDSLKKISEYEKKNDGEKN